MQTFDGWEIIKELGEGGQGAVYLVRSETAVKVRASALTRIGMAVQSLAKGGIQKLVERAPAQLAEAVTSYMTSDQQHLGALKRFKIPENEHEAGKAISRLQNEVKALREISHPNILKLLAAQAEECWIVTEYHVNGTLAQHRDRYKGDVRAALEAFRPVVQAVAELHKNGHVHRDIKPENIFIASDGRLVLGDFGVVFFQDEQGERLTSTYERVGSRDWMAPWGNVQRRLEEVNPTFDIFPLGKVLWAMISGERGLPFWYYDRGQYNLERIFSDNPADMRLVNQILGHCIVENEKDCLTSASDLLLMVYAAVAVLRRGGQLIRHDVPIACRFCGQGTYALDNQEPQVGTSGKPLVARVYICNVCGNTQMFKTTNA